jgi:SAM-dependent methyltransferase
MRASDWIGPQPESILDVGCNVGAWLHDCHRFYPKARLAGIEINRAALAKAREKIPNAELREAGAEQIPFADRSFQYVTCMEVLEHLPTSIRSDAFREFRRVLRPKGRLILTTPHAGLFAWLDSNNVRFCLPRLYRWVARHGLRDSSYASAGREVEWHYHFSKDELLTLAGKGWKVIATRFGGLFLYPFMDWLSWPFYRLGKSDHSIRKVFERIAGLDYRVNYGPASYGIMVVLERDDEFHSPLAEEGVGHWR